MRAQHVDPGVAGGLLDGVAHVDLGGEVKDELGRALREDGGHGRASVTSSSWSSAPAARAAPGLPACRWTDCRCTATVSPRASSPSTRLEPMKPAPPVTTQCMAGQVRDLPAPRMRRVSDRLHHEEEPGPRRARKARRGPDQRTTLVGLGAVRDPRERGRCSRAAMTSVSAASIPSGRRTAKIAASGRLSEGADRSSDGQKSEPKPQPCAVCSLLCIRLGVGDASFGKPKAQRRACIHKDPSGLRAAEISRARNGGGARRPPGADRLRADAGVARRAWSTAASAATCACATCTR